MTMSLPNPDDPALIQPVMTRLQDILAGQVTGTPLPGMPDPPAPDATARALTEAWFTGNGWVQPVLYLSQRKDVRASLPERARLLEATEAVAGQLSTAHWLFGLLLVLDDEDLIVLHRADRPRLPGDHQRHRGQLPAAHSAGSEPDRRGAAWHDPGPAASAR